MFSLFQYGVGERIGVFDPTWVVALQAVGGAAGNMIAVHNVVAASATVGLVGKEGLLIRNNMADGVLRPVCRLYRVHDFVRVWHRRDFGGGDGDRHCVRCRHKPPRGDVGRPERDDVTPNLCPTSLLLGRSFYAARIAQGAHLVCLNVALPLVLLYPRLCRVALRHLHVGHLSEFHQVVAFLPEHVIRHERG